MSSERSKRRPALTANVALLLSGSLVAGQAPNRPIRAEPGLVVVSAINDAVQKKDYEAVETVQAVDPTGTRSATDWAIPDRQAPGGVRRQSAQSVHRAEDLEHA